MDGKKWTIALLVWLVGWLEFEYNMNELNAREVNQLQSIVGVVVAGAVMKGETKTKRSSIVKNDLFPSNKSI